MNLEESRINIFFWSIILRIGYNLKQLKTEIK